jgi:streptogramin lyase
MRFLKRRSLWGAVMAAAAVALISVLGAPVAGAVTVGGVERFTTKCGVGQLVAGPDGNVWFNCFREAPEFSGRGKALIGRITPAGNVAEFSLPGGIGADSLVAGPDGNLWFTFDNGGGEFGPTAPSSASAIGRITPAGSVTLFRAGLREKSRPQQIINGPEGDLWFVDGGKAPAIGRITPAGVITEFPTGVKQPLGLGGIAAGPEGNLFFTQVYVLPHGDGEPGAVAGRLEPSGTVTSFGDAPAGFGAPAAAGGAVWFADTSAHQFTIDRVTPSGELVKFSQGLTGFPTHLVAGPEGNLWYTAQRSIGRVTPTGEISTFTDCLNYHLLFSEASTIVSGPGGDLWFTSVTSRQLPSMAEAPTIGRVTPSGQITLFKAGIGPEPQSIVAGPDGRVWFSGGGNGIERITPPQSPVNTFVLIPGKAGASGAAEVPVEVPGPGTVKLRKAVVLLPHKRTLSLPGAAAIQASPSACGAAPLRLQLRGKALAQLRDAGSLRVRLTATFTPTGGTPNTETRMALLRGPRHHH